MQWPWYVQPKNYPFKITNILISGTKYRLSAVVIILFVNLGMFGQEMTVIDHKGTRVGVKNNLVTTAATAPNNPLENDIWFDTAANVTKVYDGSAWLTIHLEALTEKEDAINKSTDTNLADATNTKFPTELAVKTYVDSKLVGGIDDDITAVDFDNTTITVSEGLTTFSADLSALEESADITANTTLINNHIAADGDLSDSNEIQNAAGVSIDDTVGNFTATDVEGALAELGAVSGENIYTVDGAFTADRAIDLANNDLNFDVNSLVVSGDDNRVGIGTASPTDRLHVAGNLRIDSALKDKDGDVGTSGQVLSSTAIGIDWVDVSTGASLIGGGLSTIWAEENSNLNPTGNSGFQFSFGNGSTSRNGVFVGYESLAIKLSFSSATVATGEIELYVNGIATGRTISITSEESKIVAISPFPLSESDRVTFRTLSGSGGSKIVMGLVVQTNGVVGPQGPPGDAGGDDQTASEVNIADSGANFTATDVEGALAELALASQNNLYANDGSLTANRAIAQNNFDLNFDANTLVVSGDDDYVGIGTDAPTNTLTVRAEEPQLDLVDDSGVRLQLGYSETNTVLSNSLPAQIITNTGGDLQYSSRTSNSSSKHVFFTPNAGVPTERLRISTNGNVGIGTTTPNALLDVKSDGVPLRIAPSTTTPTGSQAGQMFMGADGILYAYDGSRGKWLSVDRNSVSWSYDSSLLTNAYLNVHDGAPSSSNGYRMLRNATITGITAQTGTIRTWVLLIVRSGVTIASLTIDNAQGQHSNSIDVDLNEGDSISAYCAGTSINYPLASIEFAWRN